jgi:ERF superfamily
MASNTLFEKEKEFEVMGPEAKPQTALVHASTPMELLSYAVQNNSAIDVIERLSALQEKALARDAESQFNAAMNKAQAEIPRIAPDLNNPQTSSRYASYRALDKVVRPVYIKHGFSLSFDTVDSPPETVRACCYVSHRDGHTRRYQSPVMPADGKGAKGGDVMSKTHATGAAMSYAMRYLLKYIFNIAIGEDDNDGNHIDDLSKHLDYIANSRNREELDRFFTIAKTEARKVSDTESLIKIVAAKDRRKKELGIE